MRPSIIVAFLLVAGVLAPATSMLERSALAASLDEGIGIRLTEAPVEARADSRAWRYIIDHLAPGSVIRRRVEVSNTTGSPRRLSLYAAAAEVRDRRFRFAPGRTPNELSTWTTANRREVSLAPHARSTATITIRVPDDAAPGERYAVIWAEATDPAPPGGGVALVHRVGIRVYLSVGRGNPPGPAFTIDSLAAQRTPAGQQAVLAQVHNTGGRALDLSGDLRLSNGPGSLRAGPFKVQTGTTLAPGDVGSVTAVLDTRLPDGPWLARIQLASGLTKGAAEATITFPAAAGTAQAVKAEMDTGASDVIVIITGIVMAVLVTGALLLRRAGRRRRERVAS
ncbi:hypothetical protein FHU36_005532 [Nonomuraea muscovyensis]|uniref:Peptidase n=1 Tax=Nonomuraea muscovyensis TaxID=1124761 RepID=A0A7X0C5N9_9ACTN|nr:peptidase [Nonomuraea muscovyensis]MBB6348987.1 hypothetical protein [Nonomuraea muscovyensis]